MSTYCSKVHYLDHTITSFMRVSLASNYYISSNYTLVSNKPLPQVILWSTDPTKSVCTNLKIWIVPWYFILWSIDPTNQLFPRDLRNTTYTSIQLLHRLHHGRSLCQNCFAGTIFFTINLSGVCTWIDRTAIFSPIYFTSLREYNVNCINCSQWSMLVASWICIHPHASCPLYHCAGHRN